MERASDIFSFAVGVFGVGSTFASLIIFVGRLLPNAQFKVLDELYNNTDSICKKAEAENLLPNERSLKMIQKRMAQFDAARETLRTEVYQSMSGFDEIRGLFGGLTKEIMHVSTQLKKMRRWLVTTTQKAKEHSQREQHAAGDVASQDQTLDPSAHVASSATNPHCSDNLSGANEQVLLVPEFDISIRRNSSSGRSPGTRCLACFLRLHRHGGGSTLPTHSGRDTASAVINSYHATTRLGRGCSIRHTLAFLRWGRSDPANGKLTNSSQGRDCEREIPDVVSRSSTLVDESSQPSPKAWYHPSSWLQKTWDPASNTV